MREMAPDLLLFAGCLPNTPANSSLWGGAADSPSSPTLLPEKSRARSCTTLAFCFWHLTAPRLPDNLGSDANDPSLSLCPWEPALPLLGQSDGVEGWQMGGLSSRNASWVRTQLACVQIGRC